MLPESPAHACARVRAITEAPTAEQANALLQSLWLAWDSVDGLPLTWVVEHVGDGHDPLPAAWAIATDDVTMFELTGAADVRPPNRAGLWSFCASKKGHPSPCPGCADAIRRHVPTLTLADVLAAARRA
jgi:hypothetical protein